MKITNFRQYSGTFYWGIYIEYTVVWKTKKTTIIFYNRNEGTKYKVEKITYSNGKLVK